MTEGQEGGNNPPTKYTQCVLYSFNGNILEHFLCWIYTWVNLNILCTMDWSSGLKMVLHLWSCFKLFDIFGFVLNSLTFLNLFGRVWHLWICFEFFDIFWFVLICKSVASCGLAGYNASNSTWGGEALRFQINLFDFVKISIWW